MRIWSKLVLGLGVVVLLAPLGLAAGCRSDEPGDGYGVHIRQRSSPVGTEGQVPADKLEWR